MMDNDDNISHKVIEDPTSELVEKNAHALIFPFTHTSPRRKKEKVQKTNTKLTKRKLEDLNVEIVTLDKDLSILKHPSNAFELFLQEFANNYKETKVDLDNFERVKKKAVKAWNSLTNKELESYFNAATKLKRKLHLSTLKESVVEGKEIGKRERKPKIHFDGTDLKKLKQEKSHKFAK
ncbi:uncharacterized protein LOC114171147 isoform X2 [Vigna unguiculata]|uniref:uncharacterized protein LOC114171147 isoform X2 n=1 Tax=Vigna unguiculata TaxID=3917 RepID=UPI001016C49C|nr:uncharacterized protein LOC114171147 isoform X2 [Vigna unguiculata]